MPERARPRIWSSATSSGTERARLRYPLVVADSEAEDPKSTPLERAVRALVSDVALRPVLIVVVLVLGTFVAGAVLLALGGGNIFAMAALAGMALLTAMAIDGEIRSTRRMTLGVWAIASVWLAAALIGFVLSAIGAF